MANDDHTDDTTPSDSSEPEPGAPASELEQERAASFGDLVDGMLTGLPSPPAMRADERALIEVASVVNVVAGDPASRSLDRVRVDNLIDAALRQAVSAPVKEAAPEPTAPVDDQHNHSNVTSITSRRLRRSAPWLLTVVAAAAALFFALRPAPSTSTSVATTHVPPSIRLSTDVLVGKIHKRNSGEASSRIDLIYTDRLALYRSARFGGRR